MGGLISGPMAEQMRKNQQTMLEAQRLQLERQLIMQQTMVERQMAMQLGRTRDLFYWLSAFYGTAALFAVAGFRKRRNPAIIIPFVPLTFIVAYFGDLAIGNKMERIRVEAESILEKEGALLQLPGARLSIEFLDHKRLNK